MTKTIVFACLLALSGMTARADDAIVIDHVAIIDGTGAAMRPDMRVTIRGQRIVAIAPADAVPVAGGIDASGKFLIPGLWDFHVHTGQPAIYLPLYVANGITGVRDMGGDLEQPTGYGSARYIALCVAREAITRGALIGPRMVLAGFLLDGERWPGNVTVANGGEGRIAVAALQQAGVDFIKVKSSLSADSYAAIADEARRRHMVLAGHVPATVGPAAAAMAGQRSIEHLDGIAVATAAGGSALAGELQAAYAARDRPRFARAEAAASARFDARIAAPLFATLAQQQTWQVPTLVELRRSLLGFAVDAPAWRYLPPALREQWGRQAAGQAGADGERRFAETLALVRAMHRAGVPFIAGTDSANASLVPGFSLHDELGLLVAAGMSPMQALQAATLHPARYLGQEAESGTIAIGKRADLVLLNANPLVDIANTRTVEAVVLNGRLLQRGALDALLDGAAAAASAAR